MMWAPLVQKVFLLPARDLGAWELGMLPMLCGALVVSRVPVHMVKEDS